MKRTSGNRIGDTDKMRMRCVLDHNEEYLRQAYCRYGGDAYEILMKSASAKHLVDTDEIRMRY